MFKIVNNNYSIKYEVLLFSTVTQINVVQKCIKKIIIFVCLKLCIGVSEVSIVTEFKSQKYFPDNDCNPRWMQQPLEGIWSH